MILSFFNLIIPLAQLYFLWKILRALAVMTHAEDRKRDLTNAMREMSAMFSEAAGMPPKRKKKVVSFEAVADEE